jgi:hypothetical protein
MPGNSTYNPVGAGSGSVGSAATIAKAIETEIGDNLYFGQSSIDNRTLIMRSVADDDGLSLYEQDGKTPVVDGSIFVPGSASSIKEKTAVPVQIDYNFNAAARVVTTADILLLVTTTVGQKKDLVELSIEPDLNNPNIAPLTIQFTDGGLFTIASGVQNFGVRVYKPVN